MVTRPRLLIVEDDLDLSEMISSYFGAQNYQVETVAWASEALTLSDSQAFDLILLDIRLPDMDGFEVCRKLRENRRTKDTPILFLTERRDRNDKLQGLELGVVDYITKPFDLQELGLRIRNAIVRAAAPASANLVTDLPEGRAVQEKLTELLTNDSNWSVLCFNVTTLSEFSDRYGFVAAQDMLRALGLIIRNAMKELGGENSFIGHLSDTAFVIISDDKTGPELYQRITRRIEHSRPYFYPAKEDETLTRRDTGLLQFISTYLTRPTAPRTDVESLRRALLRITTPPSEA